MSYAPLRTISRLTQAARRTKLIDDAKSPNPRFRGLVHGTACIVREEGIRGIYRGLFPVVRPPLPLWYFSPLQRVHSRTYAHR